MKTTRNNLRMAVFRNDAEITIFATSCVCDVIMEGGVVDVRCFSTAAEPDDRLQIIEDSIDVFRIQSDQLCERLDRDRVLSEDDGPDDGLKTLHGLGVAIYRKRTPQ